MKTIAFLITTPNLMPMKTGEYNGYVAVPPEHPLYGKGDNAKEVEALDVHGGITFTGRVSDLPVVAEYIDDEIPAPGWWALGFDTCHYGDTPRMWNRRHCTEETRKLQKQIEEIFAQSK